MVMVMVMVRLMFSCSVHHVFSNLGQSLPASVIMIKKLDLQTQPKVRWGAPIPLYRQQLIWTDAGLKYEILTSKSCKRRSTQQPQRGWNQRNDPLPFHSSVSNVQPGRQTLWHCGHGEPLAATLTALLAILWWFKVVTRWNTIITFKKVSKSIWIVLATAFLPLRSWVELSSVIRESAFVTPHIPWFWTMQTMHFLPPHHFGFSVHSW